MGSRRFQELTGVRPAGHARPVKPEERRRQGFATHSYIDSSEEVVFGAEMPIEVETAWRQLPPEGKGSDQARVWVGFEIRTQDPALKKSTLVIAAYPYSTDWFDWADFKRILNRDRDKRLQPLRAPYEIVKQRFRSRQALRTENLESRPGWLTARLSMPTRTTGLSVTSRARLRTERVWKALESSVNGRYRTNEKDLWCFGVCQDFEKCCELMRISPQATRLLDTTDDGTLFKARGKTGVGSALKLGAAAKSLAHEILEGSIIKALAGSSPKLDRILALGKPPLAALLMEQIYQATMYNLARRLQEPDAAAKIQLRDLGSRASTTVTEETSFDEKVEMFRLQFRKRKPSELFRHQIESTLTSGDDPDREAACAALAASHQSGYVIHRSFEPILQKIVRSRRENPSVSEAARFVLKVMRATRPPAD